MLYEFIVLFYLNCCKAKIIRPLNGIHIHRDSHDSHRGGSRGSHRDGSRGSRHGGNRGIHGDHNRGVRNREHRRALLWFLESNGKQVLRQCAANCICQGLWFTFSKDTDGTEKSEEEDGLHDSTVEQKFKRGVN